MIYQGDSSDYSRNGCEAADENGPVRVSYINNGGHAGKWMILCGERPERLTIDASLK